MGKSKRAYGGIILQLAVSLFLIVAGILALQDKGSQDAAALAVYKLFDGGSLSEILVLVLGICELIAGVYLLLSFFINVGKLADTFILIITIVWIVVIVLVNILGVGGVLDGAFSSKTAIIGFLKSFSSNLLVLGALLIVWKR